jgi:hypothetical protein
MSPWVEQEANGFQILSVTPSKEYIVLHDPVHINTHVYMTHACIHIKPEY